MDMYDFLRRMAEGRPIQPYEQQEIIEIIEEYRRLNVFGSLARQIRREHEHVWIGLPPHCQICTVLESECRA